MATTISTSNGDYVIYHVSEAGIPSAHDTGHGEWFFHPTDLLDGEVFSDGYPTQAEAEQAARWHADEESSR